IAAPAAEEYIDAPPAGAFFLRTSPELEMKRLLCAGMDRIYQIGPCFRAGERGRLHRTEFDMLEFYMAHADYLELLDTIRAIIVEAAVACTGGTKIRSRGCEVELGGEWTMLPVREAFRTFANVSADEVAEQESLFEEILVEKVEPNLPKERPCVLIDYPIRFGAFARAKASDPTLAERWEVYVAGVELANTYGELIDPVVQRERFAAARATRKRLGLTEYPEPTAFLDAIDRGMPPAAGSALGFDRLVMLLAGADSLSQIDFPLDDEQEP
ncbi:MAG: EF-P lysine aminoacylase GenX, partial [Lentisphaeria bacterium]|nr:EF-P lysine aminoacylase GenX [Lentisphaeria bacterium]